MSLCGQYAAVDCRTDERVLSQRIPRGEQMCLTRLEPGDEREQLLRCQPVVEIVAFDNDCATRRNERVCQRVQRLGNPGSGLRLLDHVRRRPFIFRQPQAAEQVPELQLGGAARMPAELCMSGGYDPAPVAAEHV